jgi:hypothetical protein
LSQLNNIGQAEEQRLDGVDHHALCADRIDGVAQAHEEPLEVVGPGFLDIVGTDMDMIDGQPARSHQRVDVVAKRGAVCRQILGLPSKLRNTPGSSKTVAPLTRKFNAKRVLPDPGPPQTSEGRPVGRPPMVIASKPTTPVGDFLSVSISYLTLPV